MIIHFFNWGMGVESTAQLCRWIFFPKTRPFQRWSQVIIILSQTGDEFWETKVLIETFIFPLLRSLGVRMVEIGKASEFKANGYVLLSDTTQPYALHIRAEGIHSLGENMELSGWVPRLNRPHICAQRWKGEILDLLVSDLLAALRRSMAALAILLLTQPEQYAPGFLLTYVRFLLEEPLQIGPYIMYNAEETKRVKDSEDYGCHGTTFIYPLVDDGWTRDDCLELLYQLFSVIWHKSCCDHCPFQSKANRRKHYAQDPIGAARAMWREHLALAMNPRMKLFDTESVRSVCEEIGQVGAITRFEERVAETPHALYYVRRIYRLVGNPQKPRLDASRKVEIIASGTQAEMVALLQETAQSRGLNVQQDSHWRAYSHVRDEKNKTYPAIEGYWVVSPVGTKEKCARKNFDAEWRSLCLRQQMPPDTLAHSNVAPASKSIQK